MSKQLVLVTGVTGFIAGQIFQQLLAAGYRVRGTARGSKFQRLNSLNIPDAEFVEVANLADGDLTEALKGVDVVMHTAAPLPGQQSAEDLLKSAVDGTLNIVKQANKAGIKKIVVTETFGNTLHPSLAPGFAGINITDSEWGATSKEDFLKNADNAFYAYFAAKNLAERALWEYAVQNPHLDIATILPGFVFGPWSDLLPKPTSTKEFGTNYFPYIVFNGGIPPVAPPFVVDVRDVALAHVRALGLDPVASGTAPSEKRFLVNGGNLTWREAAEHISKVRPEKAKPAPLDSFPELPGVVSTLDTTRAKEVLKITEFIDPKQTIVDVADDIFALLEQLEKEGVDSTA
jgi:nucleoside-diphosphate-sugar epimerase